MLSLAQAGGASSPERDSLSSLSLRLGDSSPLDSQARCTPWSVFQDGRLMIAPSAPGIRSRGAQVVGGLQHSRSSRVSAALFSPVPNRCTTAASVALKHTRPALAINSPYPGSTFTSFSTHSAWLLFTFPSRYLFAIGHAIIFSFRRALPPD